MPPTGLSRSHKASLAETTQAMIRDLMLGIASSPITLYEVVAGGPLLFRNRFLAEFRGLAVDGHIADLVFKFFCDQVVKRHPGLAPQTAAGGMLDRIEVKSQPTEAEIEASWVHEVFSQEEGRRVFYGDGAGAAGQDHKVIVH